MTIAIRVAAITDKGLNPHKPVNEDSFLILEQERIFVVADGVGGAYAGDVASQTVTKTIRQIATTSGRSGRCDPPELIRRLIQQANSAVYEISQQEARQMGSTIVLLAIDGESAYISHVGDSRIYIIRNGRIMQLTKDDSKLQKYRDKFPGTPDANFDFVDAHVITNALGINTTVDVDVQKVLLNHDDLFLLCTDGIYNHNSEADLLQALTKNRDNLDKACEALKENCYAGGAKDHLTAVLVRIRKDAADLMDTQVVRQKR